MVRRCNPRSLCAVALSLGLISIATPPATADSPIVAAGTSLVAESCQPPNAVIDPFENVTVSFCIRNNGPSLIPNLIGTMLSDKFVRNPPPPQVFGFVAPGARVCRNFQFNIGQVCGGVAHVLIEFHNDQSQFGPAFYTFTLGSLNSDNVPVCCLPPCGLICPDDITVDASPGQCSAAVEYPLPTTVGDLCGEVFYGDRSGATPSGTSFNVGSHVVFAQGGAGANCTFNVTVLDTQPPVVTCPPEADLVVHLADDCTAAIPDITSLITRTDNCPDGRATTVTQEPPPGTRVKSGTQRVRVTVTDNSGNTSSCDAKLTITGPCGCGACGVGAPAPLAAAGLCLATVRRVRKNRRIRP